MRLREVVIFTGAKFQVPERIQRIDQESNHGWQLRYGRPADDRTEWFADFTNDGSGAAAALQLAISALQKRVKRLPAPSGIRVNLSSAKGTDLPAGVSGPTLRSSGKPGRTPYYCYQVSFPVFGKGNSNKAFYIGTEKTADAKRRDLALAKAVEFRVEAVRKYELAKTRAKRISATEVLSSLQATQ